MVSGEQEWFGFHFFGFQVVRMVELLGLLGFLEYIREGWGFGSNERRVCIETTSLMISKTILINGVDVYEKYTKQMLI